MQKRIYSGTMLVIFILIISILTACGNKVSQTSQAPNTNNRPTDEQMQTEYLDALAADTAKVQKYDFNNLKSEYLQVRVFEKFEATFQISAQFQKADYFNVNVVDIFGYFTTPSGQIEKTPAFYYKEDGIFGLRYSPREVGEYQVYLKDEISGTISSNIEFEATEASDGSRGFLGIAGNKIIDSYGEQFTIFGTNYAWGSITEFNEVMPLYKENGLNFVRFWGQCPWSPFNLERSPKIENSSILINEVQNDSTVEYEGIGIYSLVNAGRFDDLIETFENNDVYIMYCWRNLWEFTAKHWETNPYNIENGGMCYWKTNDSNFWTHPLALKYQKDALRYIMARYSYSTSFAVFEYWNECDNKITADTPEISANWHKTMDEYLKSIDIYNMPTTTSYAWLDHKELNGRNPWKDVQFLDIFNGHRYSSVGYDPFTKWQQQNDDMVSRTGDNEKPIFFGEFSEDGAESKAGGQLQDNFFKEGIWGPLFFMDTAGTNLYWRTDNTFRPSENMLKYMKIASGLITPYEAILPEMDFNTYSENNLKAGSFYNEDTILMYVRDENPEDGKVFYTSLLPRHLQGMTVKNQGLAGEFKFNFYSTENGELIEQRTIELSSESLTIKLPDFTKDLFITGERIISN